MDHKEEEYHSSEDEDYVPELDEDELKERRKDNKETSVKSKEEQRKEESEREAQQKRKSDELWASLQTNNSSQSSTSKQKAPNYINKVMGKNGQMKTKKRKIVPFKMSTLGIDSHRYKREKLDVKASKETEVVKFAGEEYVVQKQNQPKTKGHTLDAMVEATKDTKKINTLEKTSMDWEKYKQERKIQDELEKSTKDGFIERQDFLSRVDQRQFELEKQERIKNRKKL